MLTTPHRQEALCRAYVQAIAGQCGMSSSTPAPDYGIDLSLHDIAIVDEYRFESGLRIDVQAKATTRAGLTKAELRFDLAVRDYDSLRLVTDLVPRVLIVLVLPGAEEQWLNQTEGELVLRHCAYWSTLRGLPKTRNRKSIRVVIPRANVLSVDALREMMKRVREGGLP